MKDKLIGFKATMEEFQLLNEVSQVTGMTKSEIMRNAMVKYLKEVI